MNRRNLLRGGGGLLAAASVAGCLDWVPTVGETSLGLFAVYNFDSDSGHRFDIRIERDGTMVHESTHQLEAYGSESEPSHVVPSCTWDDKAGDYSVSVRRDGEEWHSYNVVQGELRPPECVIAYVQYGNLSGTSNEFSFELDETDCSEVSSSEEGCSWAE